MKKNVSKQFLDIYGIGLKTSLNFHKKIGLNGRKSPLKLKKNQQNYFKNQLNLIPNNKDLKINWISIESSFYSEIIRKLSILQKDFGDLKLFKVQNDTISNATEITKNTLSTFTNTYKTKNIDSTTKWLFNLVPATVVMAIIGKTLSIVTGYENTELYIMFIPVPIKAKWAVALMVALDLFGQFGPVKTGIGHYAHLSGLVTGFLLILYWNKNNKKTFY